MTPVQVFEADSGDLVIAFLGTMGSDGVLIWRGEKGWGFHEAQSVTWDGLHQTAYRNHRATVLDAAALKERGVPWPDPTGYRSSSRQWKDNFTSEVPFSLVHESALAMLALGSALPVHLILYEDLYETAFGDGRFLYPYAAFWDADQCKSCVERLQDEEALKIKAGFYTIGRAYTAKEVLIRADLDAQKVVADLRIEAYQHFDLNGILLLLDPRMDWQAETCSAWWRAAVFPPVLARLDSRPHDPIAEQVWIVTRRDDVQTPLGAIRQAVVEATFWSETQAQKLAQQSPPRRDCYPVRICAHQSEKRLVAYLPSWVEGLSLHNVIALLALA